jgi:hypothetical protein
MWLADDFVSCSSPACSVHCPRRRPARQGSHRLQVPLAAIGGYLAAMRALGQVLAGIGMDVQTAMVSSIYNKSVTSSSRGKYSRGEIINIQSNDALKIANTSMSLNAIWATPANLIIAIVLLLRTIGTAAFAGMAVLLASIPFNTVVYWALASIRIELLTLLGVYASTGWYAAVCHMCALSTNMSHSQNTPHQTWGMPHV